MNRLPDRSMPQGLTSPTVTLVGAGPGDPDLLTVRAVKAIRRATVLLVDDLVGDGVLRYARKTARIIHVGKRGGCQSTPQEFIHRLMVAQAKAGERVVRLKGGDPFVFGRGGEECDALRAAGIGVEVVSGLTAGIAGPASIGLPVTDRRHSRGVALVTGHQQPGCDGPDWAVLARSGLTLVIYMGRGALRADRWRVELVAAGLAPRHACRGDVQRLRCRTAPGRCARWSPCADDGRSAADSPAQPCWSSVMW